MVVIAAAIESQAKRVNALRFFWMSVSFACLCVIEE
jgi:hypothetical protein